MTKKSKKGIVGKKIPTFHNRQKTGLGLSFTNEHVSYSSEIEYKVKEKDDKDIKK